MKTCFGLAALAMLTATSAFAASDLPSGPKRFVGSWQMGHEGEGSDFCTIRLDADGAIGGAKLVVPKACKGVVDRWDDLYAWYVNPVSGELVMADATRHGVYHFHRIDQGIWASEGSDDTRYLIYFKPAKAKKR